MGTIPIIASDELLRKSFSLYRKNWKLFIGIGIIALTGNYFFHFPFPDYTVIERNLESFGLFLGLSITAIGVIVVSLAAVALMYAADRLTEGKRIESAQLWKISFRLLPTYLWVYLLYTLMITFFLFLLFLPGLFFAVYYVFAIPAVIIENRKGKDAFSRSRTIEENLSGKQISAPLISFRLRHHPLINRGGIVGWWHTFIRLFFLIGFFGVISLGVSYLLLYLFNLSMGHPCFDLKVIQGKNWSPLTRGIFGLPYFAFSWPLINSGLVILFKNFRLIAEQQHPG